MQFATILLLAQACGASVQKARLDRRGEVIQGEGSNIEWTLACNNEELVCGKIAHALPLMARFLENVFVLEPLRIHVEYFPCPGHAECEKKRLASCRPSQMIETLYKGQTFLYPQALFKQGTHSEKPQFESFDMFVKVNGNGKFYFPSDYPTPMRFNQNPFLDVLVHEVNHGLGFKSTVDTHIPDVMMPLPTTTKGFVTHAGKRFQNYTFYFSAYDKHVVSRSQGISFFKYAQELAKISPTMPYSQLKKNVQSSHHYAIFKNLTSATTIFQDLYFQSHRKTKVNLETTRTNWNGIISHLDDKTYKDTMDLFMVPGQRTGSGVHKKFKRGAHWFVSPYGIASLDILQTLGYKRNPNTRYENSMEYHYYQNFKATPSH